MSESVAWVEAYVGLGSNLDDPMEQVVSAARELTALKAIEQIALSPLYASRPVGPQDQPDYVNAVVRIRTSLTPMDLLGQCQTIENKHGRVRTVRWGARTLDLDILLYDNCVIDLPDLIVPHLELSNRAFVLYPLADVAPPDLIIPNRGSLTELLAACPTAGLHRIAS